jgi:prefoldin subunit 5
MMEKDEFLEYKRQRLEEIAAVIRASEDEMGRSMEQMNADIDALYHRLEKLRSEFEWLK